MTNEDDKTNEDDTMIISQGDKTIKTIDLPHKTASTAIDHGPSEGLTQRKRMIAKYSLRQSDRHSLIDRFKVKSHLWGSNATLLNTFSSRL